jgi:hypothetical protein
VDVLRRHGDAGCPETAGLAAHEAGDHRFGILRMVVAAGGYSWLKRRHASVMIEP